MYCTLVHLIDSLQGWSQWVIYRSFVCSRVQMYRDTGLWGKVNGELHGLLSIRNGCGNGTISGACRLLSRAVLAVSAYCLQHLTPERKAERSCSLALRSMMLSCVWRKTTTTTTTTRKTTPSTTMLLKVIATGVEWFMLFLLWWQIGKSFILKKDLFLSDV